MEKIMDTGNVSDSDDDLLGITDSPIIIKTYPSQRVSFRTGPTLEVIDHGYNSFDQVQPVKNKYQRFREISGIRGYVVNVHDATNFDIDLNMSPELHERYQDVIFNQYTYQDMPDDCLTNLEVIKNIKTSPKISTAYRCRLRGIGVTQLDQHTHVNNYISTEIRQLVDRADGWVECTICDVDVYQRLLIDVNIKLGGEKINIKEYLLSRTKNDNPPMFYMYAGKKEKVFFAKGHHY